jgi:hypothetical protein
VSYMNIRRIWNRDTPLKWGMLLVVAVVAMSGIARADTRSDVDAILSKWNSSATAAFSAGISVPVSYIRIKNMEYDNANTGTLAPRSAKPPLYSRELPPRPAQRVALYSLRRSRPSPGLLSVKLGCLPSTI